MRDQNFGLHWGQGAARYYTLEGYYLDEQTGLQLMPVPERENREREREREKKKKAKKSEKKKKKKRIYNDQSLLDTRVIRNHCIECYDPKK